MNEMEVFTGGQVVAPFRLAPAAAEMVPRGMPRPVGETLPAAVQRIAEVLHPEQVVLFGSYAYGTPTPDSDVDLLVVMETTAGYLDRHRAVSQLLAPRRFPVDILVKTPEELRQAVEKGSFFYKEITSRGLILYERRH